MSQEEAKPPPSQPDVNWFDDLYDSPAGIILAPVLAVVGFLWVTIIKLMMLPFLILSEFWSPRDPR